MNKLKCYIILNLKKKLLKNILEMQWLVLFILNIFSFFEVHYQCILFYYQKVQCAPFIVITYQIVFYIKKN